MYSKEENMIRWKVVLTESLSLKYHAPNAYAATFSQTIFLMDRGFVWGEKAKQRTSLKISKSPFLSC